MASSPPAPGSDADFEKYSRQAVHFFSRDVPPLLDFAVSQMADGFALVDLGCGDGPSVYALAQAGLLSRARSVVGVDLSPLRIERFTANTGYPGLLGDGERVGAITDGSQDLILSTMVIEHVADDAALLAEIHRMLRPGGWLYVSTVFKRPGAWYFRRAPDGRWVLDPTHRREYKSRESFEQLVQGCGLRIRKARVTRLVFPVAHPILRIINAVVPLRNVNRAFASGGPLAWLEKIALPIPRYRSIEVLAQKDAGAGAP